MDGEIDMEAMVNLMYGFSICLQPVNLLYCFLGVLLGTLVGVLPGIGPAGAIALLIPMSIKLPPESSVIMLTGIMYGASYGCSTTSILMNIPGEPASIVTCLDGYRMARQGRAGPALGISAFASFIAGTTCIFGLIFFAPFLANFALKFGPPEYFSLMVFSFTILIFVIKGGMIKGLTMLVLGLALATVGLDPTTGDHRFTLGIPALMDGVGLVQAVIGLYGVSEILVSLEEFQGVEVFESKVKGLLPTRQDWKDSIFPILRSTVIGFFLGIIPGIGLVIPSFLSYGLEKRLSRDPGRFGTGFIAGVAAPESANNAASAGHLVPLLSLGIPAGASSALIFGALMIAGVQPGPMLIKQSPQIFWGLVASLYIGNVMLVILNLPLIGLWVRVIRTPYYLLSVYILIFCLLGSYAINYSAIDIIIMTVFGVIGYIAKKTKFEVTPMVFGLVLGTMLENALRRSLILSHGSFSIFFRRPISLVFIGIAILVLFSSFFLKREEKVSKVLEGNSF
jgi:putative tricarboxylic transport membrane protein